MSIIPQSVKVGTIVGMGLQIALVGMTSIDLIVANNMTIIGIGNVTTNYKVWIALFGLFSIGSMIHNNVQGAIVIGIFATSLLTWYIEDSYPTSYFQIPILSQGITTFIDFSTFDVSLCWSAVTAFVFIGVIDVSGVMFGMAKLADLMTDDEVIPGSSYAFLGVSAGTMVGACIGSTPVIVYVESAAGIKEGGRTGLTAVFVSFFFILSLFLAPLFASIPVTATSPVSMLVGVLMMSQASELDWDDMSEAIPAFLTMTLIPFTFSITDGIMFGLLAASFFYVTTGKAWSDVKLALLALSPFRRNASSRFDLTNDVTPPLYPKPTNYQVI